MIEKLTYPLPKEIASHPDTVKMNQSAKELGKKLGLEFKLDEKGEPISRIECGNDQTNQCLSEKEEDGSGAEAKFIFKLLQDDNSIDAWFYCDKCLLKRLEETIYSI